MASHFLRRWGVAFAAAAMLLEGPLATAQTDVLRIGLLTVKTGPLAGPGRQMEDGLRFFLKQREGNIAGRPVELVVADTAGQPASARNKAQELVERSKVRVIVGPLASTELLAIDDYIKDAKVPTIVSSGLAEDLTQRAPNAWMVRATSTAGQISHPIGEYAARTLGYKRVATIATDFAYGHEVTAGFQRVFEDNGGKVVQKIWVPPTATDFAAYVSQLRKDVDAIFCSFSGASATGFIRQYAEFGMKAKVPLLATMTTVDESLLKDLGDNAAGIVSGGIYSAAIDTPENARFVAAYRAEAGVDPGFYVMGGYTAGLFLEAAMKATQGRADDAGALVAALRAVKLESSFRGPIAVDRYGNTVTHAYIRKTERKDGRLQNVVLKVYPAQTQFWTYDPQQFLANPVYSRDYPPAKYLGQ